MEAEIERMNNELAVRTDYESDSYMELIEKVALMSEKFYAIDMTHFEEDVEKALLGLGFERSDFDRPSDQRFQRRMAHAYRTGETPAPEPGRPAAGRADQPPGHRIHPMAGGFPHQQCQGSGSHQPRPEICRQHHHPHHRGDHGTYL